MLRNHCGDCYELLTDVRVLNQLANLGDPPRPPYPLGVTWYPP